VRRRVGGQTRIGAPITSLPGPDPHYILYYLIPDRASHYSTSGGNRKGLEAILAALSGVPVPYGPADGATGSYL
jgi:hypothetical protein